MGDDLNACDEGSRGQLTDKLRRAAAAGDAQAVMRLIAGGADVNAVDKLGASALHWAAQAGKIAVSEVLLQAGAEPSAAEHRGLTPLHLAADNGWPKICALLIEAKAAVSAAALDGSTPLHKAADRGHFQLCEMLLAAGADPYARDEFGCAPMDHAITIGALEICRLFEKHAPGISGIGKQDFLSPLELAVDVGQLDVVKVLVLECGADLDKPLSDGATLAELVERNAEMHALLHSLRGEVATRRAIGESEGDGASIRSMRPWPSL